ncbi:MAG: hypothetical protein ABFS08_01695 [Pseudomonadota bacterium]
MIKAVLPNDNFERLLFGTLAFVTIFALIPWQPQGPFDARDWSLIEGVRVTMPWWQLLLEPVSALGHILTGAPNFRFAAFSLALWVVVLSWLWIFLRRPQQPWWRRGLWASVVSLFAFWCVPAMMLFFSHLHFPGWQLEVDDPQWLAADLQSHTLGSHDALVRAEYNLHWHAERGYDVVGITEHDDPAGSFYAEQLARQHDAPTVIPGVEVANEFGGFLLGMGLKPQQPLAQWQWDEKEFSKRFTTVISDKHEGAVISMAWRLAPQDIEALADDGVHAFELMNAGHPDIPDSVRDEMLRLEGEGRIRLVSSTDWHGWSGNSRTWTLLRVPGAEQMSRQQQVHYIVKLLREGSSSDVIPVVAGYQGDVTTLRLLFSPLVEAARYAAELSPLRLLSWWGWALLLWLVAQRFKAAGIVPGKSLWGLYLLIVGILLMWKGVSIYQIRQEGYVVLSNVTEELGMMAILAAAPLLLVGSTIGFLSLRQSEYR